MFDQQKSDRHELPAELAALEERLAHLTPAAPRLDRDRLMFAAGRAAHVAGPSWAASRLWPTATGLMTAATLLLAVLLAFERRATTAIASADTAEPHAEAIAPLADHTPIDPAPAIENQTVEGAPRQPDAWPWAARPTTGYLALRHVALTEGVAALGGDNVTAAANDTPWREPPTVRELLEELLPETARMQHTRS